MSYRQKKKKRKLRPGIKLALIILILLIVSGLIYWRVKTRPDPNPIEQGGFSDIDNPGSDPVDRDLTYIVFDEGQGLSVLISMGDTQILIDGSSYEESEDLPDKVRQYATDGVVEWIILTHSHEDHCGGLQRIYENFSVMHTIYGDESDEGYYWYFKNACLQDGGTYENDKDLSISLSNGCVLDIYDIEDGNENPNNNSVVTYVRYKNTSFLCTGDLEKDMEGRLTAYDLHPTVVVAGHHGSNTSNSLLGTWKPDYFIISAGANNGTELGFWHPHKTVLEDALKYTKNKNVYGTWKSGDIIFVSDGNSLQTNVTKDQRLTVSDAGAPK